MNLRIISILLLPLLILVFSSSAYSHWTDVVKKKYSLKAGSVDIEIGSFKAVYDFNDTSPLYVYRINEDNLQIVCDEVFSGWYVWVGVLIHNRGTLPASIDLPEYVVHDPDGVWPYFSHMEYFYGPYDQGDFTEVWKYYPPETPPPPGEVSPPVTLKPSQKLVVWELLELGQRDSNESFTIEIVVRYRGVQAVP